MKTKYILAMIVALGVSIGAMAKTCAKCHGTGFVKDFCTCRHCNGSSTIAPGRLGKYSSVMRWTVESSYIGGVKIGEWESEKKTKYYSNMPCPACRSSAKRGLVRERDICQDCKGVGAVAPYNKFDVDRFNKNLKTIAKDYTSEIKTLEADYKKNLAEESATETHKEVIRLEKEYIDDSAKRRDELLKCNVADIEALNGENEEFHKLVADYIRLMRFNYDGKISKKYNLNTYEEDQKKTEDVQ